MAVPTYTTGGTGEQAGGPFTTCDASAFVATAGRVILVACQADTTDTTSVTDTAGNTYNKLGSTYTGGGTNQTWWLAVTGLGNATNVVRQHTDTGSGADFHRVIAMEFSGASGGHDTGYAPAGNQDSSSPFTTTAANTAGNDEIIVGQFSDRTSGGAMSSSSPSVFRLENAAQDFGTATNDAATSGSWAVSVVNASTTDTHSCFAVALKSAAAATGKASLTAGLTSSILAEGRLVR